MPENASRNFSESGSGEGRTWGKNPARSKYVEPAPYPVTGHSLKLIQPAPGIAAPPES